MNYLLHLMRIGIISYETIVTFFWKDSILMFRFIKRGNHIFHSIKISYALVLEVIGKGKIFFITMGWGNINSLKNVPLS